jgi:membrane protein DedA with SNARE-associated domain
LISIPAGAAHMPIWEFLVFSTLGTAIWNTILIYLGALAGKNWGNIIGYLNTYSYVICIAVALALTIIIIRRVKRKRAALERSSIQNQTDDDNPTY